MRIPLPRGVVLLYTMLILGVTSIMALTIIAETSLGGFLDVTEEVTAIQTRASVMGCVDEFLIQLQKNTSYAPSTLTIGTATCNLTVTSSGGTRSGLITLTQSGITRGARVDVTVSPFAVTQITETLQ